MSHWPLPSSVRPQEPRVLRAVKLVHLGSAAPGEGGVGSTLNRRNGLHRVPLETEAPLRPSGTSSRDVGPAAEWAPTHSSVAEDIHGGIGAIVPRSKSHRALSPSAVEITGFASRSSIAPESKRSSSLERLIQQSRVRLQRDSGAAVAGQRQPLGGASRFTTPLRSSACVNHGDRWEAAAPATSEPRPCQRPHSQASSASPGAVCSGSGGRVVQDLPIGAVGNAATGTGAEKLLGNLSMWDRFGVDVSMYLTPGMQAPAQPTPQSTVLRPLLHPKVGHSLLNDSHKVPQLHCEGRAAAVGTIGTTYRSSVAQRHEGPLVATTTPGVASDVAAIVPPPTSPSASGDAHVLTAVMGRLEPPRPMEVPCRGGGTCIPAERRNPECPWLTPMSDPPRHHGESPLGPSSAREEVVAAPAIAIGVTPEMAHPIFPSHASTIGVQLLSLSSSVSKAREDRRCGTRSTVSARPHSTRRGARKASSEGGSVGPALRGRGRAGGETGQRRRRRSLAEPSPDNPAETFTDLPVPATSRSSSSSARDASSNERSGPHPRQKRQRHEFAKQLNLHRFQGFGGSTEVGSGSPLMIQGTPSGSEGASSSDGEGVQGGNQLAPSRSPKRSPKKRGARGGAQRRGAAPGSSSTITAAGASSPPTRGGRKKPAAAKRGCDAARAAGRRTLFSFTAPSPADDGAGGAAPIAYTELSDIAAILQSMEDDLNDPNRIQAPPLYVAFITQDCESNFSLSEKFHGKNLFARGVDPSLCHLLIASVVIRWRDSLYALAAPLGLELLSRVARDLPGVEMITFNAPAILLALLAYHGGSFFTKCVTDVRVMGWMLNPAEGSNLADFSVLVQQFYMHAGTHPRLGSPSNAMQGVCERLNLTASVYRSLYGQLGAKGLLQPFLRQEKRIALLCATMKYHGFLVNSTEVGALKVKAIEVMDHFRAKALQCVPSLPDFNIQSPDHCRHALYDVLGLAKHLESGPGGAVEEDGGAYYTGSRQSRSTATTKGGKLSTAEDTLRTLANYHELPRHIIAFRKAAKLLHTYTEGLMDTAIAAESQLCELEDHRLPLSSPMLPPPSCAEDADVQSGAHRPLTTALLKDAGTGVVAKTPPNPKGVSCVLLHPNYLQEGTDTGRLSCVEPNLQNIPRSSQGFMASITSPESGAELGNFRSCFVAPRRHVLVAIDYEQIELRVLAHLCGDPALVNTLTEATDIHRAIAQIVFTKPTVTAEERAMAKRAVFGVLYGAGARTLASNLNVSLEKASHVQSLLRSAFPRIEQFHRKVVEQCRRDGFVRTFSGRIRPLPEINDAILTKRSYAERQAFNTVVQGSAADIVKLAMIAVEDEVLRGEAPTKAAAPGQRPSSGLPGAAERYPSGSTPPVPPAGSEVKLLSQIHDELIFSVPATILGQVVPRLQRCMIHCVSLLVPLRVTVKVGRSLGRLEEWSVDHELGIRDPSHEAATPEPSQLPHSSGSFHGAHEPAGSEDESVAEIL